MTASVSQRHLGLSQRLAGEINKLSKEFNIKNYSMVGDIDGIISKKDMSIEKKKNMLIKRLHELIAATFSINRDKFSKKAFDLLRIRLNGIRKIIDKLRSINYYLETIFIDELGPPEAKKTESRLKLRRQNAIAGDELEALEYTAYKLIEEVVMLDKRLLKGYVFREKRAEAEGKVEVRELGLILEKESELLEHLEAKLPPPRAASMDLLKDPNFTHWVARVFALLSYLEHIYGKEASVFSQLKKNSSAKIKISKKITQLAKEQSKLLGIMEEKTSSMKAFRIGGNVRREVHNFTATINL